jgi:hypothetical protein
MEGVGVEVDMKRDQHGGGWSRGAGGSVWRGAMRGRRGRRV